MEDEPDSVLVEHMVDANELGETTAEAISERTGCDVLVLLHYYDPLSRQSCVSWSVSGNSMALRGAMHDIDL